MTTQVIFKDERRVVDNTEEHLHTPGGSTREDWKNTILAGLANYIDAGSIVAGSVALALWQKQFGLSDTFLGTIAAFGPNAIGAGVGALIGGRLCDKLGRKKIYQWDLLIYAAGMLLLVFAVQPWMIVVGFLIVGLAVGADIPASWSLIAEMAPDGHRGKHSGVAQVLWYLGPVVVLLLALVFSDLGVLGARLVFAHLVVVALLLWAFRFGMQESSVWTAAKAAAAHQAGAPQIDEAEIEVAMSHGKWRELFNRDNVKGMLFLIGMYGIWNLWAGTNGFFFPYILQTVGNETQAVSVAIQSAGFVFGMLSIFFVFMRLSDRVNQRVLVGVAALVQVIGMLLLAVFPLTLPIAFLYIFLLQFGGGFGQQSFFQLWSAELFPTLLRSTAQGVTFAVVRIGLGIWSFFVPFLVSAGFTTLAWILTSFLAISGLIAFFGAPRNEGKSLEEIQYERHHVPVPHGPPGTTGTA
jgi:inositol transporter-like SP family MFS transporter